MWKIFILPMKLMQLTVSFSPAFGGSRNDDTTISMVIRHGRIMAALISSLEIITFLGKFPFSYLYAGEVLCNMKVTSG